MQVQIYKKTGYVSVLLAFLLHALLCFFLFILVIYHYKQTGSLPSHITQDQDQTDIFLDDLDNAQELESQEPEAQEIKTENQIKSEPQAQHITQAHIPIAYPSQAQNIPEVLNSQQTIEPDNNKILVQDPSSLMSTLTTSTTNNYASEPTIPITRRRIRKRKKASKINFQQIANYVQKYSQERSSGYSAQALPEDLGDGVYIDPKGVPHRKSDSDKPKDSRYAHVDDDLAKMTFYSYMKGV